VAKTQIIPNALFFNVLAQDWSVSFAMSPGIFAKSKEGILISGKENVPAGRCPDSL
jgi:hypothetical protein